MDKIPVPSADQWLREAKADAAAADCGMFLLHNGVVRRSAKARVRAGDTDAFEALVTAYQKQIYNLTARGKAALKIIMLIPMIYPGMALAMFIDESENQNGTAIRCDQ